MDVFTWGIIGPGWIASEFAHDLQLAKGATFKIGPILGRTLEEAVAFSEKEGGGKAYDDLELFVKEAQVDAVYIATPHPLHYKQTIACLNHRIPVLCEKPVSVNGEQFKDMEAAARQNQTFFMEALWLRFLPSTSHVLSILKEGKLGAIQSIKSTLSYKEERDPENRFFNPELGGGSLLDLGSYNIFLGHLLLGVPTGISARAKLTSKNIDETCSFQLSYPNQVTTTGDSSFISDKKNIAEISCENGKMVIGDAWNEKPSEIVVTYQDGTIDKHIPEWEGRGFQFEIEEVVQCLKEGKKESEKVSLQFSREIMNTMDEIRSQAGIVYPYDADPAATPDV